MDEIPAGRRVNDKKAPTMPICWPEVANLVAIGYIHSKSPYREYVLGAGSDIHGIAPVEVLVLQS